MSYGCIHSCSMFCIYSLCNAAKFGLGDAPYNWRAKYPIGNPAAKPKIKAPIKIEVTFLVALLFNMKSVLFNCSSYLKETKK